MPDLNGGPRSNVSDIQVCGYAVLAHQTRILHAGEVFCWGSNLHHQCSPSDAVGVPQPQVQRCLQGVQVTMVASGLNHSLALSDSGDVYTWGANDCGQLGHGCIARGEARPRLVESFGTRCGTEVCVAAVSAGSR